VEAAKRHIIKHFKKRFCAEKKKNTQLSKITKKLKLYLQLCVNYNYTVSQKNIPDIFDCNLKTKY